MCGRYTLRIPAPRIAELFHLPSVPDLPARYNIAPSQSVATVKNAQDDDHHPELATLRWGLIPHWAKDPSKMQKPINARSETAASKPFFRDAFRRRRCLVLADGFYEWQKRDGKKQPYYIRMKDEQPFAFAGLWEEWTSPDGEVVESCTLLTTTPNDVLRPLHNRMPVIVSRDGHEKWLSPEILDPAGLMPLLGPYPADEMTAYPVSTFVNNPRNESPECIAPE